MKKLSIIATMLVGLFLAVSCDSDRDSNPVLQEPSSFVLNTPAIADQTYDLDHASTFRLSTSQPAYGYTAATTYFIQASLHADMSDYLEVSATAHNVNMEIKASKFANAVTQLLLDAGKVEADFPQTTPVYIRLRASLGSTNGEGEVLSNVVELKSVRTSFCLPPVELPTTMYIKGGFNNWSWKDGEALKMVQVNGAENEFWHMVWIDEDGIKFNSEASDTEGQLIGYEEVKEFKGEKAGDIINNNGNIASKTPGWYLLYIQTELDKRDILYTVNVLEPKVWLNGQTIGGDWDVDKPEGLFTVPTSKDGEFVSPAFLYTGELRAYVKLSKDVLWWQSEFIYTDDKIDYRGLGGDQARVTVKAGQRFYLNFLKEKARVE